MSLCGVHTVFDTIVICFWELDPWIAWETTSCLEVSAWRFWAHRDQPHTSTPRVWQNLIQISQLWHCVLNLAAQISKSRLHVSLQSGMSCTGGFHDAIGWWDFDSWPGRLPSRLPACLWRRLTRSWGFLLYLWQGHRAQWPIWRSPLQDQGSWGRLCYVTR